MKTLKLLTTALCLLCITTASAQWWNGDKIKGNGDITSVTRNLGDYEGLKAAGPMDFKLVPGNDGNITIKGDSNLMEYIITEVKDDMLVVKLKKKTNIKPTKTIVVTVPYQNLNVVTLAGSGDIDNTGTIKSDNLKVALAGSGDINLNIDTDNVTASIAGSGDIKLAGSTNNLTSKIAGSGDFDGDDLESNDVTVQISGSGTSNVVCNGDLKVRISGSGDVRYSGNPTNRDTKVSGSGSVSGRG